MTQKKQTTLKASLLSTIIIGYTAVVYHTGYGFGYDSAKADLEAALKKNDDLQKDLDKAIDNIRVVTKTEYVDVIKTITKKETEYVYQAINLVPPQFDLSNGWVYEHDRAAQGSDADARSAADATPSGIEDNQGLAVVVQNYSTCRKNAEQLAALQKFIRESQDRINKANKQ
jgi:hypothetical protein